MKFYTSLASAGADVIVVPSAFIFKTGSAHWETLLRSRAIETSSNIIAPAQCGIHKNGRVSWGHSMTLYTKSMFSTQYTLWVG